MTFYEDFEFEELNDLTIYINTHKSMLDNDWKKFKELEMRMLKMKESRGEINTLVSISLWYNG